MFNILKHVSTRSAMLAVALFATATGAFAQAPTDAQKSAIRSACRSDFMAHCASVTPGGVEAYQCLQKNMSGLSSGCQTAVRAVEPAAAPKTEAAPKAETAPAAPKAESAPAEKPATLPAPKAAAAKQPNSAQVAAVKSACRADYPKVCASVPPGGAPALECLEKNKAKVSPACEKAVTAAAGGGAAATAAPAVIVLRPLRPREELLIVSLRLRRRHPHAVRRRRARRRSHRTVHRQQRRIAVARMQGCAGAVRCTLEACHQHLTACTVLARLQRHSRPLPISDFNDDNTGRKTCVHSYSPPRRSSPSLRP
ncbi:pyruvate/2-oxoglutarate dehydrogenase complex dihydrolipoamide acyltransferase (E2) component [Bradyrhizobium sp. LB13.1]